jgi:hypothetical protein
MLSAAFQFLRQSHLDYARLAVANNLSLPLHDPDLQATSSSALVADARPRYGNSGNQSLFRNKADERSAMLAATFQPEGCTADGRDFEKIASLHRVSPSA